MRKKITGIFIILWMIIIFAFSAQPAVQSSEISGGVAYRIAEWQNHFFRSNKSKAELYKQAESMQLIIRKGAHMGEYALLAFFLCLHLNCYAISRRQQALLATGITAGYAATDEFHQLFVPGRAGRFSDVCIDTLGGILGLLFWLILFQLWYKRKQCFTKKRC